MGYIIPICNQGWFQIKQQLTVLFLSRIISHHRLTLFTRQGVVQQYFHSGLHFIQAGKIIHAVFRHRHTIFHTVVIKRSIGEGQYLLPCFGQSKNTHRAAEKINRAPGHILSLILQKGYTTIGQHRSNLPV